MRGEAMTQTEVRQPVRVVCPEWCSSGPCSTGGPAHRPDEVMHTSGSVYHAVPDGSGLPGRYPVAFYFELACFSETAAKPGAPYIIFDEDCNTELRDVAELDDLIDELESAVVQLRGWRKIMASHYGEPYVS
ncbi:DUF6907 domain-containing protein [Streptomyces sp. NPDC051310]|uniref:DUF6907 domain-containing protein n=1 Tax=Streptomyces sp. NPDC051310 TaxID=3365649 RepID=UPI0037B52CDB